MMDEKTKVRIIVLVVFVAISIGIHVVSGQQSPIGECNEYECDVKTRAYTTISITKEGEYFGTVQGERVHKTFIDPLTMYDEIGNKIAYADDNYHLIAQNSHSIFVSNEMTVEMVGLVDRFGESYDIYNADGQKIAHAKFNFSNTKGQIHDNSGNLIADSTSKYLSRDYKVRITERCQLDEKTMHMIFASYYSDQRAG